MSDIVKKQSVKTLLDSPQVQERLKEILGKNAATFATSVVQITQSNTMLANAEPNSIVGAAMTAATLNLPLNNSLGFAYIVPFRQKQPDGSKKTMAQFMIGAKGYRQLAMRSGQFVRLNETDVKEGEIKKFDRLSGDIDFEFEQDDKKRASLRTVGYVSFFRLKNGFEATYYMTSEELNAHAKKYSQTFKAGFGQWKDDFDSMARKTVLKLLLSKSAPLSIEMERAITTDQAIINDEKTEDITYVDNEETEIDHEAERVRVLIEESVTQEDLDFAKGHAGEEFLPLIKSKQKELNELNKK